MKQWPPMTSLLNLESEPCSGEWSLLKILDAFAIDHKIHAAGWNFFFLAAEVKVIFLGSLGALTMQNAVRRILEKVKRQNFNGLEITGIVSRHFLGVPYVTVSAHSRHVQRSCNLDSFKARQECWDNPESANG